MGQLIKLQDYASRYEQNIFHYPSRFVTLKKQQWEKLRYNWETPNHPITIAQPTEWKMEEKQPFLTKIKTMFNRRNDREATEQLEVNRVFEEQEDIDQFSAMVHHADNLEELKQQFLNQLFDFQLKWATSTLAEKSIMNKKFFFDEHLRYFLQRFPDTYLVLYRPIFLLKKAKIEVEPILISPTEVWCITFLEEQDLSVFVGSNQKFWEVRDKQGEKKIVNPIIPANRTEKIVKNIFQLYDIELPVHKVILSRNGYIDYPLPPYDVTLIDKRNYEEWFSSLRGLRSPLKSTQLKGAKALLDYCQTTSIRRMEWETNSGNDEC
ncbi:nuclease-related domain-containing protein [Bacillus tuaregi]|uniref:nuclease-related domain-containing protein n=1 Tax=Bacillus tuaregi TaxID=1816695 RepID=UPI0008F8A4FB|nr:nuclease-related domain-containing protein [Bacillus tuaregi]